MDHEHNGEHCCDACNGATTHDIEKKMMDTIIEHGHQVTMVFPTEESVADGSLTYPFAYTIGRAVKDRPELLITGGLPPEAQGMILNSVAELDDAEGVTVGEIAADKVLDGYPLRVVKVDPHAAEMNMALHYMGEDIEALQILWPDSAGRFPGETDYEYGDAQPVFEVV